MEVRLYNRNFTMTFLGLTKTLTEIFLWLSLDGSFPLAGSFSMARVFPIGGVWPEFTYGRSFIFGQSFSLVKVFSMAGVFLWSEFCEKFPMTRVFSYVSPITGVHPRPQFPYGQGISIGRSTFPMGKVTS